MPIVISKDEWGRIEKWTHRDKEDPEVVRRREYVRYLDATSQAMTKDWPNSLENVNKRNEELRRARLAAAEQTNSRFYKRYVRRKHAEQERLMYSARDTVFKNKDAPKLMLSAVIETVIQKERIEQLKFLAEQRRLEAEQKKKDDDEIIRRAEEWHKLVALKDKRRYEANKKHQKDIVEQAKEVADRKRSEYEAELQQQKIDNYRAQEEIDAIDHFDEEFKAAEKNRIWSDMQRSRQENAQRRAEQEARARMDDRLVRVLMESRARVERRRKQTEKELKEEKQRVLDSISKKLESGDAARDALELAIRNKAIAEKDAISEARRQADHRNQERIKQERLASREQYLRDEERRRHELHTMRHWELMNRFKNAELYEDFQEHLRKEKERKIKEYREDILKLWKERTDREARELAETRYFYGELAEKKIRDADNKLLTHAAALIEEAKANERPDHALQRAVDRYCKLYRLYPMPELPASLAEHFRGYAPRDDSRPDPAYTEPKAPPPDPGPDAPDPEDEAPATANDRRDGLQLPGPSAPPAPPAPRPDEDYRRAGRADGLQRRPAQTDLTLPPIKVIPCKTESCRCELKR